MIQWDTLTAFGLIAVGFTALCYALEGRAPLWTLGFGVGSALSSVYGFLQGAWPFGVVEIIWTVIAVRKFAAPIRGLKRAPAVALSRMLC